MNEELERYKEALSSVIRSLRELPHYDDFTDMLESRIADALRPPPEFEEVEVTTWGVLAENGGVIAYYNIEDTARKEWPLREVVKLTGTIKRPVKRVVVKEVSVEVSWERHQGVRALPLLTDTNADFEWESLLGKTGTLIFRYTE